MQHFHKEILKTKFAELDLQTILRYVQFKNTTANTKTENKIISIGVWVFVFNQSGFIGLGALKNGRIFNKSQ